ncbi:uncharacterized isomerase BH0283-like isoform X5 [Panicum virgatum]|uniref:uncharacterized isomerase BH0283-like isoform X5 n=1 Tax=Panicum virgatum TaxID=38727 RepID=UPI0019D526CD|nr:uncharacterized isomerase BH0283-like isoform X5 [Panicum virgatum]
MPKRAFRYAVVDAFTGEPFKGNAAAVCLLEDGAGDGGEPLDERWMQAVAAEFNTPITAFLARSGPTGAGAAEFRIRWFTPVREVEVSSCAEVDNVCPNIAELVQCPGRGVAVTGPAREGSSYDFVTRFFSPKYGINEDPVCASVHCSLAPYWGKKLGKENMIAFMASPRTGTLYLQWDEEAHRVRIRGEAVTVMVGTLLA